MTDDCTRCGQNPGEVCRGCHAMAARFEAAYEEAMVDGLGARLEAESWRDAGVAALREPYDLLREVLAQHNDPCRIDHNGFCQEHLCGAPCLYARIREALQ